MTVIKHELKQGLKGFCIWTAAIASLIVICVFMYPEMKGEMGNVSEIFSSMGSFTEAFGMDRLNFGTLVGFYAIECGNILGLGGAFFAALISVTMLPKEEKDNTAEFLFTHPKSRFSVISAKLSAVMIQILVMNIVVWLLSAASMAAIGEQVQWKEITLLHTAYTLMQIETAGICFAVSAFIRRGSLGVGLGIAALMYFLNIVANISDSALFLKYITPFGYTEGADIITDGALNALMILCGMCYALIGIVIAYLKYMKKDLR